MRTLLAAFLLCLLALSCSQSPQADHKVEGSIATTETSEKEPPTILTSQQEAAFEALNTLQVNTDPKNHLYSTFPTIRHPCTPADTSYVLSQTEFQQYLQTFVTTYCQNLPQELRDKLAQKAVLAQANYRIVPCYHPIRSEKLRATGTWLIPNILGRRDLILVW